MKCLFIHREVSKGGLGAKQVKVRPIDREAPRVWADYRTSGQRCSRERAAAANQINVNSQAISPETP